MRAPPRDLGYLIALVQRVLTIWSIVSPFFLFVKYFLVGLQYVMLADFFRPVPKKRVVKLRGKQGIIFKNIGNLRRILFYIGDAVFVGGLFYLVYLYYPLGRAIIAYKASNNEQEIQVNTPLPTPTLGTKPDEEYSVTIPKILAYSQIVPNINPFDINEYDKVLEKDVVAQAKGSFFPGNGEGKSTYLFAHSTRQGLELIRHNSVFYLLGELKTNDTIFVKYMGKVYTYLVYDQKVVSPKQVEYLKYSEPDKEVLIMQTCWPIGTDWNRLLVFAKRVE